MSQVTEKTYQMLWDCKYCGQRKNLGLTHRCCPSCGAPQDPGARYFPPDTEKVAVEDHPYVGVDVRCPACGFASSRAAKCCGNCGSPLGGARDVALVGGPPVAPPLAARPPKKRSALPLVLAAACLALVVLGGTCALLLRKRAASFEVAATRWTRTIAVERLELRRESAWCDSVPSDGRVLGRRRDARGTKQVPDGQTCTKTKKDLGNGAYKEVQECKPKFRDEPTYDDKCDYEAPRWTVVRTEKADGESNAAWPAVRLAGGGASVGAEREGARTETYTVELREPATGRTSTCELPHAKWLSFARGQRYAGKVGAVTGSVDCGSLVSQ